MSADEPTTPKRSSKATPPATPEGTAVPDVDLLPDDHPHKVAVAQGYFGEVDPDQDDLTLEAVTK